MQSPPTHVIRVYCAAGSAAVRDTGLGVRVPGSHLVACRALLCRAVRSSKVHRNGEGASREEGALVGGVQLDPREGGAAECEVEHSRVAGATVAGADARRARFRVPIRLHAWQP